MSPLRQAVRALSGLEPGLLAQVLPEHMGAVLFARGWECEGTNTKVYREARFTIYNHKEAQGRDRYGEVPWVQVPMYPSFVDYTRRVVEWATDVATRHGDVATAEILGEALALLRA